MNIKINWRTLFDEEDEAQVEQAGQTADSPGQWLRRLDGETVHLRLWYPEYRHQTTGQ